MPRNKSLDNPDFRDAIWWNVAVPLGKSSRLDRISRPQAGIILYEKQQEMEEFMANSIHMA
jgi:hypothetical protein